MRNCSRHALSSLWRSRQKSFNTHSWALLVTSKLQRQAKRLSIEIPDDRDGWWKDAKWKVITENLPLRVLTERGQLGARRLIKEERLKNIEQIVKIVIPILTALTGLLGVLFGLLTLLWKS
jgi:hypothetical protein